MVAGVTAGVFMVGGERHIVTTGAIAITAPLALTPAGAQPRPFNYAIELCFRRSRAWRPVARQG
jgi:hypothetical protein